MSGLQLPHQRNWQADELSAYRVTDKFIADASLHEVVNHCKSRLCYLATPYSKVAIFDDGEFDPTESLNCAMRAALWARMLALEGLTCVSPIIQAVEMVHVDFRDQRLDPLDVQYWEAWCRPLLMASEVVVIPPIAGWAQSDAVWTEAKTALEEGKRVITIFAGEGGLTGDLW
ncbi:MAG: DUF1937 family protein [Cognatishimia activa]